VGVELGPSAERKKITHTDEKLLSRGHERE
jgi:hypothetical protein